MRWRRIYLSGRCTDCKHPWDAHGRNGLDCPTFNDPPAASPSPTENPQ